MGSDWRQTGAGVAQMVGRAEGVLKANLGRGTPIPRAVLSDRGPGLCQASTGHIVGDYYNALKEHGFRAYAGVDASKQPPDMPGVFPHETAVAWTRQYLKKYPLAKGKGLDTMERELADRLDECKKHIDATYDVGDLCSSYARRMKGSPTKSYARTPPQWFFRGPQGRAAVCRWLAGASVLKHRRPP